MTARSRFLPYLLLVLLSVALFVPGQASPAAARSRQVAVHAGHHPDVRDREFHRHPVSGPTAIPAARRHLLAAGRIRLLLSAPEKRDVWAYRVPSLIGATLSVLLTAWIGNLLFGRPTGFVAAVLLAVSLILGVEARMAKIDAVLLAVGAGGAGRVGEDLSRVDYRPGRCRRMGSGGSGWRSASA